MRHPAADTSVIVITIAFVGTAEEYNAGYVGLAQQRPAGCPGCAGTVISGHGSYERRVVYVDRDVLILVRRWRCKCCGGTISMLPSVVHRHRHYALVVIEMVLRGRLGGELVLTWRGIEIESGASLRSLRRWCAAFLTNALRWLSAVWGVLALAMPSTPMLDVHGAVGDVAQRLLDSSATLAHWLNPKYAVDAAQRVMWCWGWNVGVGRLI